MNIDGKLTVALNYINSAKNDLEEAENANKQLIAELIHACETIDAHYKTFCNELDRYDYDQPEGTTYEEGIRLEYQIEADWWHDVSLALRKLRSLSIDGDATVS